MKENMVLSGREILPVPGRRDKSQDIRAKR